MSARVRISCPSGKTQDCKVELIGAGPKGEDIDISRYVSRAEWSLDASAGIARANLGVIVASAEVQGEVAHAIVERIFPLRRSLLDRLLRRRPRFELFDATRMGSAWREHAKVKP